MTANPLVRWDLLIPLLISTFLAIVGWFIVHLLNSKRDRINKKRDLKVQYLLEAYRKLETASNRKDNSRLRDLESAVADIQLFGNARQIQLAQNFARDFCTTKSAELSDLLGELRQDIRKELSLELVPKEVIDLRIEIIDNSNGATSK